MKWSKYQRAIFKDVSDGNGHTIVEAVAGSGKSTTLLESLNHIPDEQTWLLVAFNKRIAEELKRRAPSSYNGDIRTLHSLGLRACGRRFRKVKVDNDKIKRILNKVVGKDKKLWDLKAQVTKTVSLCKGYLVDGNEFIDHIMDNHSIDTCEIDRGLFIDYVQKSMEASRKDTKVVDFNDMVWFPYVFNLNVQKYDRVFIDECVQKDTTVITEKGTRTVDEINIGDEILSYENGSAVFKKVINKAESSQTNGVLIRTNSGAEITVTHNHRLYATPLDERFIPSGSLALYLMYRSDLGFRIGVSSKPMKRGRSELADKLWVLDILPEREALYYEQAYSLEFSVPTYLFQGTVRGLDQPRINRIFTKFGNNGKAILDKFNLDFRYPHWTSNTASTTSHQRKVLYLRAHQHSKSKIFGRAQKVAARTRFRFECYSDDFIDISGMPAGASAYKTYNSNHQKNRIIIDGSDISYTKAKNTANEVADQIGAYIVETLSVNGNLLHLTNAGALRVGMSIVRYGSGLKRNVRPAQSELKALAKKYGLYMPHKGQPNFGLYLKIRELQISNNDPNPLPHPDDSSFAIDKIVEIIPVNSEKFVDLSIEDTQNFFGNGLLTHNCQDLNSGQISLALKACKRNGRIMALGDQKQCIYAFTGASLYSMDNLKKKLKAKELPLSITYRCPKLVVEAAKQFAPQIEAAPNAPDGIVDKLTFAQMRKQAQPGCFIISRANAPLIGLALGFIRQSRPAMILGRDIGENLLNVIKKSRRKSLSAFLNWLDNWEKKEVARLKKKKANTLHITDKAACLRALADNCHDLVDIKNKIKVLFEDTDEHGKIVLGTTHKCKGLERDVVYMLMPTFKTHSQEERNIYYVAQTRAKKELYYVG